MTEYPYILNDENLEIFPKELLTNPLVVFHGTTTYHSKSIEKTGLLVNTAPYNIELVKVLVETLKNDYFSKYDIKKGFLNWTTAFGIEHYLDAIQKKEFRLSFSPLSYACVSYTTANTKGGQAFRDIREAKQILDYAIKTDSTLVKFIPKEVQELFNEIEKVDASQGVVYAIQLPKDLIGIECDMNNVIYSSQNIPKNLIIGKVLIPTSPTSQQLEQKEINTKIKSKLHGNGGLAGIIWRKQSE